LTNQEIIPVFLLCLPKWLQFLQRYRFTNSIARFFIRRYIRVRNLKIIGYDREEWLYKNNVILTRIGNKLIKGDAPFTMDPSLLF